jgi:hypothetical protein
MFDVVDICHLKNWPFLGTKQTCPEWRDTTKNNVKNHSCTPNINLLAIISLLTPLEPCNKDFQNLGELFTYT